MNPCIIHSFILGEKTISNPDEALLTAALADDRPTWVHLDAMNEGTREWLETNLSYLDPFILNALLAEETRPRLSEINDGALIILRGMNLNAGSEPEDMISMRMWVDKNRIITMRRRPLKTVEDLARRISEGFNPTGTGDIVSQLAMRLFERMEPTLSQLDDDLDEIEEQIIAYPDASKRSIITDIRKRAIIFRRYIAPQKEAINHMRVSDQNWVTAQNKRIVQESWDRVTRYVEDLDAIRERAQIVKDELASGLSDKLNKNLYILSIISAIFLPLGFFTGLMGINIGGMPGVENVNAFWIFSGILIALTAFELILFKILKWL